MLRKLIIAVSLVALLSIAGCMKSSKVSKADRNAFFADAVPTGGNLLHNGGFTQHGRHAGYRGHGSRFSLSPEKGSWTATAPQTSPKSKPHILVNIRATLLDMNCCYLGVAGQPCVVSQQFSASVGAKYQLNFMLADLENAKAIVNVQVKSASDPEKVFLTEVFSAGDWALQTTEFTAGDTDCIIEFTNISSEIPGQPPVSNALIDDISIVNTAINIFESEGFTSVNEDAETSDYIAVALNVNPASEVKLTLKPASDMRLSKTELVFTKANWNNPQIVKVTAIDDDEIAEGVETAKISLSAETNDDFYSGLNYNEFDIPVEVIDAANRYYGDFQVYCFSHDTPYMLEKVTIINPCGVNYAKDGTVTPAEHWMKDYVKKAHRYGAKVSRNFGNHAGRSNEDFDLMCAEKEARERFVETAIQYVKDNNLPGLDFDIEWSSSKPPWVNYNILLGELREAVRKERMNFRISCDVYQYRGELDDIGIAAVDAIHMMSYQDFSEVTNWLPYWKKLGAKDEQMLIGMANSWGTYGVIPDQAARKTRYALDHGLGGVMLFGFDTEEDATSMSKAVADTLIAHYKKIIEKK